MNKIKLEHFAKVEFNIGAQYAFGETVWGARGLGVIDSGTIKGPKVNGTLVGPCGDWAHLGTEGFVLGDIRANWQMEDGSQMLMEYKAKMENLSSPSYSAVEFVGGGEKHKWLNRRLIIGKGGYDIEAQKVQYDLYLVS